MDDGFGRGGAAWVALCRSQAVIEFDTNGIVQWANETFLTTMGYALEDVVGRHHRMFCATELIDSRPTPPSGAGWQTANSTPASMPDAREAGRPCIFRPPTTRC